MANIFLEVNKKRIENAFYRMKSMSMKGSPDFQELGLNDIMILWNGLVKALEEEAKKKEELEVKLGVYDSVNEAQK